MGLTVRLIVGFSVVLFVKSIDCRVDGHILRVVWNNCGIESDSGCSNWFQCW